MIAEMALVAGCGMERWTSGDGPDVVVGAIGYGIISAPARRRRNHRLEKQVRRNNSAVPMPGKLAS